MRTIGQTLLILMISLLVIGGAYGISQTDWAANQSFGRRPPGGERVQVDGDLIFLV